eukprot:GHVT01086864.1.p1 GENE.GHVT01086864.1~~GHVT01086864.1.p1  ORF type:complete len:516 (+),score=43.59 GHVT01086864.1:1230-2777(+)
MTGGYNREDPRDEAPYPPSCSIWETAPDSISRKKFARTETRDEWRDCGSESGERGDEWPEWGSIVKTEVAWDTAANLNQSVSGGGWADDTLSQSWSDSASREATEVRSDGVGQKGDVRESWIGAASSPRVKTRVQKQHRERKALDSLDQGCGDECRNTSVPAKGSDPWDDRDNAEDLKPRSSQKDDRKKFRTTEEEEVKAHTQTCEVQTTSVGVREVGPQVRQSNDKDWDKKQSRKAGGEERARTRVGKWGNILKSFLPGDEDIRREEKIKGAQVAESSNGKRGRDNSERRNEGLGAIVSGSMGEGREQRDAVWSDVVCNSAALARRDSWGDSKFTVQDNCGDSTNSRQQDDWGDAKTSWNNTRTVDKLTQCRAEVGTSGGSSGGGGYGAPLPSQEELFRTYLQNPGSSGASKNCGFAKRRRTSNLADSDATGSMLYPPPDGDRPVLPAEDLSLVGQRHSNTRNQNQKNQPVFEWTREMTEMLQKLREKVITKRLLPEATSVGISPSRLGVQQKQ